MKTALEQSGDFDAYRQTLALTRNRAGRRVSIEIILDAVPASRQTIQKAFARHRGPTPRQELARIRGERARDLLTDIPRQ